VADPPELVDDQPDAVAVVEAQRPVVVAEPRGGGQDVRPVVDRAQADGAGSGQVGPQGPRPREPAAAGRARRVGPGRRDAERPDAPVAEQQVDDAVVVRGRSGEREALVVQDQVGQQGPDSSARWVPRTGG
jgi:hypothetical protein